MGDLHKLACECYKEDIPAVELVIAILTPILEEWWLRVVEDALRQGRLIIESQAGPQLAALDLTARGLRSEEVEDEIIAAFEQVLRRSLSAMPSSVVEAVEEGRDELIFAALVAAGVTGTRREVMARATALEANLGPVQAAAVQDMSVLMAGRFETRLPEVRQAIRQWSRSFRLPQVAPGGRSPATAARAARAQLEALLGLSDINRWIPFVTDQWGYRWFTIWNALDDLETGALFFRARAIIDSKTTPFCRWVDGRLISAAKIRNQVREHVRASMRGDIEAIKSNWPLLDSKTATHTGTGQEAVFGQAFAGLTLPPYHGRCRTTADPVRL